MTNEVGRSEPESGTRSREPIARRVQPGDLALDRRRALLQRRAGSFKSPLCGANGASQRGANLRLQATAALEHALTQVVRHASRVRFEKSAQVCLRGTPRSLASL